MNNSQDPQLKTLFPSKYCLTIFVFQFVKAVFMLTSVRLKASILITSFPAPELFWCLTHLCDQTPVLIENLTFFLGRIFKE